MTNPLFGRKYSIQVELTDGSQLEITNSAFEPEALRVTFNIDKPGYGQDSYWYGDVEIYNLEESLQDRIIAGAARVVVNAGYQSGAYGKIFDGDVFQVLYDRENVTDYKVTLHCLDSAMKVWNFVKFTNTAAFTSQMDIIRSMAKNARTPIDIGYVTPDISGDETRLPRGKTFFGKPGDLIRDISKKNDAQHWISGGELNLSKITDYGPSDALPISPSTGLVGTPQQMEYGCTFRCLLNPNIVIQAPSMLVKIDNSLIRQQKRNLGQIIALLDQDGLYGVCKVRHIGDTRGNDWYTDVISVSRSGKIPEQLATARQDMNRP